MQRLGRRAKRRSRRPSRVVLGRAELCAHFQVSDDQVENFLREHDIAFHMDSNQELWASVLTEPTKGPTS